MSSAQEAISHHSSKRARVTSMTSASMSAEVAVEGAFADAGTLGDVTHMRLAASECEEFACGGDD